MKKFIQFFSVSVFFLFSTSSVFATKVILTSYHKSCFIGCGSVDITHTPATLTHSDGTTENVILRTVNCTGIGLNHCPRAYPIGPTPSWLEAATESLFGHAVNQINNGNSTGTFSHTFLNVDTGKMITLYVDWVVTYDSTGEIIAEKIEVYHLN